MYNAYVLGKLLKLPHGIQSMAGFGDFILVGTQQGHILMYAVECQEPPPGGTETEATVQLLKSNTDYRKPVVCMDVKEIGCEQYILVVLSDGIVSVHYISRKESSVPNISAPTRLPHPKGSATAFALDVVRQKTLTGELSAVIRVAVAGRKKIQFFYWKKDKFLELHEEVSIPHEALSVAWQKDSVFVAFHGGYSLIKLNKSSFSDDELCELFSSGVMTDKENSFVTLLSEERFALVEDTTVKMVDLEGNSGHDSTISWSESPVNLAHDPPYLIGLTKKSIEIRSDTPSILIQTFELSDASLVTQCRPGLVFVAASSQIFFLKMTPVRDQISKLLLSKEFRLAIRLCTISASSNLNDRSDLIHEIQSLYAFDQFCKGRFKESMEVFFKLDIDPSHIIGLYPDFLPQEFRNKIKYPSEVPCVDQLGLEESVQALIEFLTQVRHRLKGLRSKKVATRPLIDGPVVESKTKLLEIIDTTLLKCYIATKSDTLVASLLRLKENQCHLEESERTLKTNNKISELVILYNTRGLHRKALDLLKGQCDLAESALKGISRMVEYLQNLPADNLDVVFEYAPGIFQLSEKDGLRIFTDDCFEAETWPRAQVFEFLQRTHPTVVVPYLEHIISIWEETVALFHNALILQYKDVILDYLERPVDEDIEYKLECTRQKLTKLLVTSKSFTAETVLPRFPSHYFFEERAILLGSLNRHTEALAIYLYQIRSIEDAMNYCLRHDSGNVDLSSSVWTIFYSLLVQPLDGAMLRALNFPKNLPRLPADLKTAFRLLCDHREKIDLPTVLLTTPSSVELKELTPFLEKSIENRISKRHRLQVIRGLTQSQFIQVQEERISAESQKIVVTEDDLCSVCSKKFRNQGAFVRLPNGTIVHFHCQEKS